MSKEKRGLEPFYLLLGPESGQRNDFIETIRKELGGQNGEPPEELRAYPYETELTELVGILNNRSLFSAHRLVLLFEAHEFKKKGEVETLARYLAAPSDSSTLLLISDEYHLDRRVEAASNKQRTKTFWELFENQKRSWIQTYVRGAGASITADAIELVLDLVENDTADLRRECEKLVLYYPNGTTITVEEVERLLYHSKNENVFSLFEVIASGDFASALETLHAITLSGPFEPAALLGGLSWQLRKLLDFSRLKAAHYSDEDAGRQAAIRGKRNLRTYQTGARTYSVRELERIYLRTGEYDVLFREVRTDVDRKLVELYLYEVVVSRGARPLFGPKAA